MGNKNLKAIGGVGSVIGAGVTIFGKIKYDSAKSMYRTASWFGENKTSDIWAGYASNYKTILIVGAVILLIGIIILIAGFLGNDGNKAKGDIVSNNASQKLLELKKLKEDNLITQEEFEEKRKQIIDTM